MYILFRGTDSKSTKKKSKKPFREQYGNLSVLRSFCSGKYFFIFTLICEHYPARRGLIDLAGLCEHEFSKKLSYNNFSTFSGKPLAVDHRSTQECCYCRLLFWCELDKFLFNLSSSIFFLVCHY